MADIYLCNRETSVSQLILAQWLSVGSAAAQANPTAAASVSCAFSSSVKAGPLPPVQGAEYRSSGLPYQVYLPMVVNQTGY